MKKDLKKSKAINIEHTIDVVEDLSHEVEVLTEEVHKQNSRSRIFWNGIISGLGRVIGATIIFAIIIAVLSYLVNQTDVEWVNRLILWLGLNTYIN